MWQISVHIDSSITSYGIVAYFPQITYGVLNNVSLTNTVADCI